MSVTNAFSLRATLVSILSSHLPTRSLVIFHLKPPLYYTIRCDIKYRHYQKMRLSVKLAHYSLPSLKHSVPMHLSVTWLGKSTVSSVEFVLVCLKPSQNITTTCLSYTGLYPVQIAVPGAHPEVLWKGTFNENTSPSMCVTSALRLSTVQLTTKGTWTCTLVRSHINVLGVGKPSHISSHLWLTKSCVHTINSEIYN